MEYIIGGYVDKPQIVIDKAINYFTKRFSRSFKFDGLINNHYFFGNIKEKSNNFTHTKILDEILIKSMYPTQKLENFEKNDMLERFLSEIPHDFVYCNYSENEGIKVYVDKFARQKIYYTIKLPFIFCSSLKFLYNITDEKLINSKVLCRLVGFGVNHGKETIFSNLNRLDVGECLRIKKNNLTVDKYWKICKEFFNTKFPNLDDLDSWIDYLYNSFKLAIDFQNKDSCVSLLSGGIDSTILAALLVKEFDAPIESVTIRIPGRNDVDVDKAILIANYYNIPHKIINIKEEQQKVLIHNYSEIFNLLEEPSQAALYSRYRAFLEGKKLGKNTIVLGDGGDESLSYFRDYFFKNINMINYMYKIPIKLRTFIMKALHKLHGPSQKLTPFIKNKNIVDSLDTINHTNFLQTQNIFESFFTTFQWYNLEELHQLTGYKITLKQFYEPIFDLLKAYPFNDLNKIGYYGVTNLVNGDTFVNMNIANYLDLNMFTYISNDIFWKNFIPIPEPIKMMGNRNRWIEYEMARKKNLLPEKYFKDRNIMGFAPHFLEERTFEIVRNYLKNLIDSKKNTLRIPLKSYEKLLDVPLNYLKKHSQAYLKFNLLFGTLGWLLSL